MLCKIQKLKIEALLNFLEILIDKTKEKGSIKKLGEIKSIRQAFKESRFLIPQKRPLNAKRKKARYLITGI